MQITIKRSENPNVADVLAETYDNARDAGYDFDHAGMVHIEGDTALNASRGEFDIEIDNERGEVALGIPDRFGHVTLYNFARADWDRIVTLINAVEEPMQWIDAAEVKAAFDRIDAQ